VEKLGEEKEKFRVKTDSGVDNKVGPIAEDQMQPYERVLLLT
jgi:hypothetical protein